ncbi:MAG: DNA polymerase I [Bacillota bacterium]|nr:DNA polymerase I [Bacillota bacterium]
MNKLIIIDGNSLINRAFFALPNLSADGVPMGGLYGLSTMIFQLLDQQKPTHFVVAFDLKAPTFRHLQYKEYKGTRKGMPEELAVQMPLAKQFLDLLGIARVELEGYEADDLIGTIAKNAIELGWETHIYTGDKDALQLVSLGAKVHVTRKGVSDVVDYTPERIYDEFAVSPSQIIDLKGLSGDTSDNIPGIPGVGPKTAAKLLDQFGTVESVVERSAEIENKRLRGLVEEHAESALLSKQLATICCDVPIEYDAEILKLREADESAMVDFLSRYQFKSLLARFRSSDAAQAAVQETERIDPLPLWEEGECSAEDFGEGETPLELVFLCDVVENKRIPALLLMGRDGRYRSVQDFSDFRKWQPLLEDPTVAKRGYDIKDFVIYCLDQGIELNGIVGDGMIAAYLLEPARRSYALADLAYEELLYRMPSEEELLGKGAKRKSYRDCDIMELRRYGEQFLTASSALSDAYESRLNELDLISLYREVEIPLLTILADIEVQGFRIDEAALDEIDRNLTERIRTLEDRIYELAGERFNIQSPKQLGSILFEKLGLPAPKKTKTGYSTNHEVLEYLSSKHEIARDIIDYRTVTKLKSTYVDGLRAVRYDGRVHTSLNQTIAVTGRLSSKEPNLQNIPIRLPEGRELRKAFIADEGCVLIDADYSQIELRVLAHLSQDDRLIEAYQKGEDIHRITASQVFDTPFEAVTSLQRTRAKEVNFGIVYGMGDFGLSDRLGIPIAEANRYIESYFKTYPGVERYMKSVIEACKREGFVRTVLGRRRTIADINNRNFHLRTAAERTARNTPIQGSAADIIKIAMIRVYQTLRDEGMRTKLILQVHDELILNAPKDEEEKAKALLKHCMEEAYAMSVPLSVEVNVGRSWYDAH